MEIHHFEYGWITPTLSYALSVLGSLLGLTCAVRVREATTSAQRAWWLMLAAWAIGGTAIWSMHFMAMLGFSVVGHQIRYDVALTAASAVIAVAVVGVGLFIAALGRPSIVKILLGGLFAGLGVAAMHYTGMAAMRVEARIDYDTTRVALSTAIAVVAATVALWLVVNVKGALAIGASALVMGVAVNGMHFTGMSAMSAHEHPTPGDPSGATASNLLVPIILAVILVVIALIYAVLAAPNEEDRAGAAYLDARIADRLSNTPAPEPPPSPHGLAARRTNLPTRRP
ncbi:MHYT domain-containing protein [Phytohabitans sp. ZYX-F-186]|uniref:MHYT domain-containing protein n=1 Tax=Phytohabitans maris TaxID=3071409 RepID=A0ABU0ZRS3_9ACTN|nr:MHYT domain-containing protein [Phytohabitans sp. ZYX-F-186]MDQ7908647.1 MHYT domain-containing protein [Phytohabitans sp. ZYX-F-186]